MAADGPTPNPDIQYILDVLDLAATARKIYVASHVYAWLLVCRTKKNVPPKSKWAQKCKADSVFFLYVNIIDDVLWTCSFYTELVPCFTLRGVQHIYSIFSLQRYEAI